MGNDNDVSQDEQHLQLLSIFHYVLAGMVALVACFPIIHLMIGLMFLLMPEASSEGQAGPPKLLIGLMFTILSAMIILFGWAMAVCIAIGGRNIARRQNYKFCFFTAAVSCLFMPLGTVLGVFTILVLVRPSVKALFEGAPSSDKAPG